MEKYKKMMFNTIDSEWISTIYELKQTRPDIYPLITSLRAVSKESIILKNLDFFFQELRKDYILELYQKPGSNPD